MKHIERKRRRDAYMLVRRKGFNMTVSQESECTSMCVFTSGSSTGIIGKVATRRIVDNPNRKALHVIGPRPWT